MYTEDSYCLVRTPYRRVTIFVGTNYCGLIGPKMHFVPLTLEFVDPIPFPYINSTRKMYLRPKKCYCHFKVFLMMYTTTDFGCTVSYMTIIQSLIDTDGTLEQ